MLYQVGLIVLIIIVALIISKRFSSKNDQNDLIYEDDMDEDELKLIDDEID